MWENSLFGRLLDVFLPWMSPSGRNCARPGFILPLRAYIYEYIRDYEGCTVWRRPGARNEAKKRQKTQKFVFLVPLLCLQVLLTWKLMSKRVSLKKVGSDVPSALYILKPFCNPFSPLLRIRFIVLTSVQLSPSCLQYHTKVALERIKK